MRVDLKPGTRVLYQNMLGSVVERIDNEKLLIDLGDIAGLVSASCSEILIIAPAEGAQQRTDLARVDPQKWDSARKRAQVLRKILSENKNRAAAVADGAALLGLSQRHTWRLLKLYLSHHSITGLMLARAGRKAGCRLLAPRVENIIAAQIDEWFLERERRSVQSLRERIHAQCRLEGLPIPSSGAIRTRIDATMGRDATRRREGSKVAEARFDAVPGHVNVSLPLERVEIDHTQLDVVAVSDDMECQYTGRPWLTIAIDVYTRCVLGIYIGFEPPSILSVALCLTHTYSEKDPLSEFGVPLPWPMRGCPKSIVVDNAMEFQSIAFRRGCDEHGIVLEYRPVARPRYGGTIERLIGTMVGRCHILPGTTKRSIAAKGDYDAVRHAALTLRQIRTWFVEELLGGYHLKEHRTLRVPPCTRWPTVALPAISSDPLEFLVDFLPRETRRLKRTGVEMHCLSYWDEALAQWVGHTLTVPVYADPRDVTLVYVRPPAGPLIPARVTTSGISACSLAEWQAQRALERSKSRDPFRLAAGDASRKRSDQTIKEAKASRRVTRRRATQAAGDLWRAPSLVLTADPRVVRLGEASLGANVVVLYSVEGFDDE